jgi:FixJ family two-component response regulator
MSPSQRRTSIDSAPTRVAVVDDDPGVRGALGRLLRVAGYSVRVFGSAEELLGSWNPAEVDCLIVDVYLGGMSGFDLHAELGGLSHAPPTVFLTAHDDARTAPVRLRAEGAVCLRKPCDDDALLEAITRALGEVRP